MSEFKAIWEGETGAWLTKGREYCFSYPLEDDDDIVSFTDDTGSYCIWYRETMEKDGWSFEVGPIKTETRRVLKSGVYGVLEVGAMGRTGVRVPVSFKESGLRFYDADELESAAMVLSQLAEFLREQDS